MKRNIKFALNHILRYFTLSKLLGGLFTALVLASLKYYISGSFHIEYCEFWNNVFIAIIGWTINVGIIPLITEFLEVKGINFNLEQLLYGFYTMKIGKEYTVQNLKPKLYNAMDSSEVSNSNNELDKGKGVEREVYSDYNNTDITRSNDNSNQNISLGKAKIELKYVTPVEPYRAAWYRTFPGLDPTSVFFPTKVNPGPGFNVPGGEVPIRDEICRHIDYNSHILNQFKKMDLETALEQRKNNIMFIKVLEIKLNFASNALSKIPTIPTTEYEFKLKNQILKDLDMLNKDKVRAEARITLLSSRIEYIESKINKN